MLPPAEVVLIRIMVRLLSHDATLKWSFAEQAPYDAVIVDDVTASSNFATLSALAAAVLKITPASGDAGPNTLQRPIRAERLQEWLRQLGAQLTLAQPVPDAQPSGQQVSKFKLLRWPPSALVRNDPSLIRMAVLLSKRALLPAELARLSQQSLDACQSFIQRLQGAGLLDVEPFATPAYSTGSSSSALTSAQKSAPATPRKTSFGQGLISGIRRRLGL